MVAQSLYNSSSITSITPSSSGLLKHQASMWCTNTHAGKIPIKYIFLNKERNRCGSGLDTGAAVHRLETDQHAEAQHYSSKRHAASLCSAPLFSHSTLIANSILETLWKRVPCQHPSPCLLWIHLLPHISLRPEVVPLQRLV